MSYAETVEALVLSRRNVGEADRLVTLFTKEKGLIKVLAKGVRKIPSRRGGHLEPLTRVKATVSGGSGKLYLQAVETQDYLARLHEISAAQTSAQRMAQVLTSLFEHEVAYPKVYAQMRRAWEILERADKKRRDLVETAVLARMLQEAGVMPQSLGARLKKELEQPSDDFARLAEQVKAYASEASFAVQL